MRDYIQEYKEKAEKLNKNPQQVEFILTNLRDAMDMTEGMEETERDSIIDCAMSELFADADNHGQTGEESSKKSRKIISRNQWHEIINTLGQIRYNTITDNVEIDGKELDDRKEASLLMRLKDIVEEKRATWNRVTAKDALQDYYGLHAYNPIHEWISALTTWDGVDRISKLASCLNTTDDESIAFNTRRKLEYFLSGAMHRWLTGKYVITLVLSSELQNPGKSYLADWLCPIDSLFKVSGICPDNKDHLIASSRVAMWEIDELGATTRRKDSDALKSFLTRNIVKERLPFGHRDETKPCTAVYIATVNDVGGFFTDVENRRFVSVHIDNIDWENKETGYTSIDKQQLYSQALAMYREGKHILSREEMDARREQNKEDRIETPIEAILSDCYIFTGNESDKITTSDIIDTLKARNITVQRGNELASALIALGAKRVTKAVRINGKVAKVYSGIKEYSKDNIELARNILPLHKMTR